MTDKDKFDESLSFVARHYSPGKFNTHHAWQRIGIGVRPWWQRGRSIAAAVACVALVASACIYKWMAPERTHNDAAEPVHVESPTTAAPDMSVRLEFADESLANVVKEIERVYGVSIGNVPDGDIRVTLSYEGDAADLIATLNELFDLNLEIQQ